MAKRLLPLLDRVLVEKIVPPSKSIGGVLLPESATQRANQGKVLAVGPGRRAPDTGATVPVAVKPGDTVLLPEYGGAPAQLGDDRELLIFREDELLGVLTD